MRGGVCTNADRPPWGKGFPEKQIADAIDGVVKVFIGNNNANAPGPKTRLIAEESVKTEAVRIGAFITLGAGATWLVGKLAGGAVADEVAGEASATIPKAATPAVADEVAGTAGVKYNPYNNPGPLRPTDAAGFRSNTYTCRALTEDMHPRSRLRRKREGSRPVGGRLSSRAAPCRRRWIPRSTRNGGNTAGNVVTARVPAGTLIYEGPAAAQPVTLGKIPSVSC